MKINPLFFVSLAILSANPLIDKPQLFDLQADPHEMNDLSSNPEHAGKIKELTALLEKTLKE